MLILLYLAAITAANLSVAHFGPSAAIVDAFLFIGLDLTARDRLHDRWSHHLLAPKMALLVAAGGLLSYLLNRNAGPIAVASTVAFALAATADSLLYVALHKRSFLVRSNGSNLGGALVDSIAFPLLAFGGVLPAVMLGQFLAKVAGGAIWSVILRRRR